MSYQHLVSVLNVAAVVMVDHLVDIGCLGVVDGHVGVLLRGVNVNALLSASGDDLLLWRLLHRATVGLLLHLDVGREVLAGPWLLLCLHLHLLPSLRLRLLGELQGLLVLLRPVELILNLIGGRGLVWLGRKERKDIEEFLSEQLKDSADIFITLVGRWALLSQDDKKAGLVILLVSVGLGDRKR